MLQTTEAATALDPEVLLSLRTLGDGDADFLSDLMTTYVEQCLKNLRELRDALARDDRTLFKRTVHTLAGASLNIGATPVAQLCRHIEKEMDAANIVPTPLHISSIEFAFRRVHDEIARVF